MTENSRSLPFLEFKVEKFSVLVNAKKQMGVTANFPKINEITDKLFYATGNQGT